MIIVIHYREQVRKIKPLVPVITNNVTINDVANAMIACNIRPVMSSQIDEVEDLINYSQGIALNMGNSNYKTLLQPAATLAQKHQKPVVLDPVGVGNIKARLELATKLIQKKLVTAVKGNASEILTLINRSPQGIGVDVSPEDEITDKNCRMYLEKITQFARKYDLIVIMTGAIDLISDGVNEGLIFNGHKMMADYSGGGCQLTALLAGFIAANPENKFHAATACLVQYGVAGEIAYQNLNSIDGNSTYRHRVIDSLYRLKDDDLERMANYEIR